MQGRSGVSALSVFVPSRMFQRRCVQDEELVRVMVGGERSRALAGQPIRRIRQEVEGAVSAILGPIRPPQDFEVITHPCAIPQLVLGHREGVAQVREALRHAFPGLVAAGTGYSGAGIENAIKEGRRAAEEIRKQLEAAGGST